MKIQDIATQLHLNPEEYDIDYFINVDALVKFLPTISYVQTQTNKEQLRRLGHLFCRNNFGVITVNNLLHLLQWLLQYHLFYLLKYLHRPYYQ